MFFRNAWYVAALDAEVKNALLPVSSSMIAWPFTARRTAKTVALEDACAHRKLPLSMGRIQGDQVQCGYHGMAFDAARAVRPACPAPIGPAGSEGPQIPDRVALRFGLGLDGRPDVRPSLRTIISVAHWGDPDWGATRGDAMTVQSNYLYVTDNLLDPSHVAWVHPYSFGNAACESRPGRGQAPTNRCDRRPLDVRRRGSAVLPALGKFQGPCDRLQHYEVRFPSHALIRAVFVLAGPGHDNAERSERACRWIRIIS